MRNRDGFSEANAGMPLGFCPRCGYRTDPGACAECGSFNVRVRQTDPHRKLTRWIRRGIVVAFGLSIVAAMGWLSVIAAYRWLPDEPVYRAWQGGPAWVRSLAGDIISFRTDRLDYECTPAAARMDAEFAAFPQRHPWAGKYQRLNISEMMFWGFPEYVRIGTDGLKLTAGRIHPTE